MFFFITVLRAMAACLITNAHYTGIYPTDLIANGGLIGDIIFFAVSGFCLCNAQGSFLKWYGKRIYRVYVPVVLITAIYATLGFYSITSKNWISYFVFPTYYHFVASIILLYIPFFFFMKNKWIKEHLPLTMLMVALLWVGIYLTVYDFSYYHIDDVHEPMIRFLFFESMLFGAYYRNNNRSGRKPHVIIDVMAVLMLAVVYFGSKLCFSRIAGISKFQIINQLVIFALLAAIFQLFYGLEDHLRTMPVWIQKVITVIAEMTLEIYVVQYVIIDKMRDFLSFPFNWMVLTGSILISAWVLHYICAKLYRGIEKIKGNKSV